MDAFGIASIIFIFLTALLSAINWRLYTAMPDVDHEKVISELLGIDYNTNPEMVDVLYFWYVFAPSLVLSLLYGFMIGGAS